MKNFVDYKWLKNNMDNEDLILLDARAGLTDPEEGINAYKKEHIQGAQFVSLEEVMTGELSRHGGRHPLPDIKSFTEDMKELGMEDDSIVVIYDDGRLAMAGRLWWLLRYFNKDRVFILEGGFKKWKEKSGATSKDLPQVDKSSSLNLSINKDMEINMDYVRDRIDREDTAIVDARAYERYSGKVEPMDKIPGHIPSAVNQPWMDLVKDGEIPSKEELKERFKDLEDKDEIIVHCGSGITGTVNLLLMEEVGLNPKLYPGGYSDWISYEENEIVKGD